MAVVGACGGCVQRVAGFVGVGGVGGAAVDVVEERVVSVGVVGGVVVRDLVGLLVWRDVGVGSVVVGGLVLLLEWRGVDFVDVVVVRFGLFVCLV